MAHAHHHDHGDGEPLTSARTQGTLVGTVVALAVVAVIGLVLLWPEAERPALAQELGMSAALVDATVTGAQQAPCHGTEEADGIICEDVQVRVTSGATKGEEGSFQVPVNEAAIDFSTGDRITLSYQPDVEPRFQYRFFDFQRDTPLLILVGLFALAVIAFGRWQGLRALVGLAITGVVMVAFLFPSILDGHNPIAVAMVSAVVIALVSLYLTHGITERTTVALLGTFGALGVTAALAWLFSSAARFTGFGTEDAFYLQIASSAVDIKGLVLAGIIIGSLGVLDDVTVTQVSAVWQIHQANPTYGPRRLYGAAVTIGRDHIASVVNTLVLAYAGASLPLLLLFTQAGRPLSDVVVGELVAVEVVRTLVGSIGLVTAVPLTTALAAWVITKGSAARAAADDDDEPEPDPAPAGVTEGGPGAAGSVEGDESGPEGSGRGAAATAPEEIDPDIKWQRFARGEPPDPDEP